MAAFWFHQSSLPPESGRGQGGPLQVRSLRTACAFKEMAPVRPEWSFKESSTSLTVTAKTKGVSKCNCDVFLSDCFLKINAPPYLLAIDLERAVDEERSKATLTQGQVSIYLHKTSPGLWGKLEADVTVIKQTEQRFIVVATDTMHRHVETWLKRHVGH